MLVDSSLMDPLLSQVNVDDAQHCANREAMDAVMTDFRDPLQMRRTLLCGGADAVAKA